MERSLAALGFSAAVVSSGVAAWALYKWLALRRRVHQQTQDKYKTDREVQRQLIHHYVNIDNLTHLQAVIPDHLDKYHERLAEICSAMCDKYKSDKIRVLDVGSGVGGTSFHLSKYFGEVIGTDVSYEMIVASQQLKQFAEYASPFSSEGGKHIKLYKIKVPEGCDRDKVRFCDEDVCGLLSNSGSFDCVVVSNVLTDLHSPKEFLKTIGTCVAPRAILIIADSYHWPEGPEKKLGGDGTVKTNALLLEILSPLWSKKETTEIAFYIAESERTAQVAIAEVSVWQKICEPDSSDEN